MLVGQGRISQPQKLEGAVVEALFVGADADVFAIPDFIDIVPGGTGVEAVRTALADPVAGR